MCDSARSKLSEGRTTSSESLFGEKASDKPWLTGNNKETSKLNGGS